MQNARIKNTVANSGIGTTLICSRLSNLLARSAVRNTLPNVRSSNFQSGLLAPASTTPDVVILTGTPIGLLLALTYANNVTVSGTTTPATFLGTRPNVRINSN